MPTDGTEPLNQKTGSGPVLGAHGGRGADRCATKEMTGLAHDKGLSVPSPNNVEAFDLDRGAHCVASFAANWRAVLRSRAVDGYWESAAAPCSWPAPISADLRASSVERAVTMASSSECMFCAMISSSYVWLFAARTVDSDRLAAAFTLPPGEVEAATLRTSCRENGGHMARPVSAAVRRRTQVADQLYDAGSGRTTNEDLHGPLDIAVLAPAKKDGSSGQPTR